jgi:ribosome biogenesis GTPase
VERLLTLAWRSGAQPVVVLTKADLVPDPEGMAAEVAAVALAVDVHTVAVPTGQGLDGVRALLAPGVTLVVVGPSGAGKSTLVNALAGRDVMETGGRRADGRGRHTTTHRELVPLARGAVLIDTPGIRGVGLVADADALDTTFADVADLAARCRFGDCRHTGEPGCAVQEALVTGELAPRRLDSWRRLQREAAYQARRADVRLAALERDRWKKITKDMHRGLHGPGRPRD